MEASNSRVRPGRADRSSIALAALLTLTLRPGPASGHEPPAPESRPAAATANAPAARTEADPAAPASAAAGESPPAEPEREWQVNERGRRFYVERLEKGPGYQVLDTGELRTPWGIRLPSFTEDERYYYFRVYESLPEYAPRPLVSKPTAEDLAAIAATYPPPFATLPTTDRIELTPFDQGLPRGGQWRNGFRLADMNGDGALDLVHGPARKRPGTPPAIFLGDGRGSWRHWSEASFPPLAYDYGDVAIADLDRNGALDLALAVHLRGVLVLAHDGKGAFTSSSAGIAFQATASEPPAFSSRTIATADWDRDGLVDVLAAGDGPRLDGSQGSYGVAWYRNLGNGAWETKGSGTSTVTPFGEVLEVADLDGDGDLDLFVGSGMRGSTRLLVLAEGDDNWMPADLPQIRPATVRAAAIADFDGDSRLDLALGYRSHEGGLWRWGLDLFRRTGEPPSR